VLREWLTKQAELLCTHLHLYLGFTILLGINLPISIYSVLMTSPCKIVMT